MVAVGIAAVVAVVGIAAVVDIEVGVVGIAVVGGHTVVGEAYIAVDVVDDDDCVVVVVGGGGGGGGGVCETAEVMLEKQRTTRKYHDKENITIRVTGYTIG